MCTVTLFLCAASQRYLMICAPKRQNTTVLSINTVRIRISNSPGVTLNGVSPGVTPATADATSLRKQLLPISGPLQHFITYQVLGDPRLLGMRWPCH